MTALGHKIVALKLNIKLLTKMIIKPFSQFAVATVLGIIMMLPSVVLSAIPVVDAVDPSSGETSSVNSATSNDDPFAAFPESPGIPVDATAEEELLILVNQLRQEVQVLRGIVEEQRNELSKLKQIQRQRYIDLDRRLVEVIRRGSAVASTAATNDKQNAGNQSSAITSNSEISAYESAVGLIRNRKYEQAVSALKAFIDTYPKGTYVPNAFYWLGQVYTVQEKPDLNQARVTLTKVIEEYPTHSKVPDAQYKLGVVYDQLGDKDKAKGLLQSVIKDNPGSSAARLADTYLRGIK